MQNQTKRRALPQPPQARTRAPLLMLLTDISPDMVREVNGHLPFKTWRPTNTLLEVTCVYVYKCLNNFNPGSRPLPPKDPNLHIPTWNYTPPDEHTADTNFDK